MPNLSIFIRKFGKNNAKKEFNKWYIEYRKKNMEKSRNYMKEYMKNRRIENGTESYQKEWIKKNPEKFLAQRKVRKAIKSGKIKKSNQCQNCPRKEALVAHHPNYKKALEVIWLCHSCHRLLHYGNN